MADVVPSERHVTVPNALTVLSVTTRTVGVGGPGYNNMMARIEARVASRPLLR